ncbi:efflux transporter outer membrane subunit [Marinigracilibium pacificum]|uniref:TolC family protein n=1 Tax=Marinigracilibium pacificum TaxID=2729599 RepID=A0A848IYC7_9BACT|nr:TolC family protein [Marinigracilibium pacificum]NMM48285.1 TolC family protein [Marinigracilibium pacificum]
MNRFIKHIGLLFISILFIQGCIATKKYERPETYSVDSFYADTLTEDTISMATLDWREIYNDPILIGYIDEGLKNNLSILKAKQNILASESIFKQRRSNYLPSINSAFSVGENYLPTNSYLFQDRPSDTHYTDIVLGGVFSWELDIWGRITSLKRSAAAQYMQTINATRYLQTVIISQIVRNYYTLVSLDAKVRILEITIENRQKGLEIINALKEAGQENAVGVKQSEAFLYKAEGSLLQIMNEIRLVENSLSILLGRTPGPVDRANWDNIQINEELNIGIPIQLLQNRTDVQAAEYNLISAFELTNSARASFYPTLSINAAGGFNSMDFDNLFSINSLFGNVIGNLTLPLFNQRKLRTQKEVRLADQQIAYYDYKETILNAYKEVSNSLYTYQNFQELVKLKRKENRALLDAVLFSEELQKQGLASYLEVIYAKDNAQVAQFEIVNARLLQILSVVELYRALGGGWQPSEIK